MSYLNNLRMVFAGDFQADVSTVNNDVRHYDNATFEERFQEVSGRIALEWLSQFTIKMAAVQPMLPKIL